MTENGSQLNETPPETLTVHSALERCVDYIGRVDIGENVIGEAIMDEGATILLVDDDTIHYHERLGIDIQ